MKRVLRETEPGRYAIQHDDREMCVVCGELPVHYQALGPYCLRCDRQILEDRYERESNR